MRRQRETVYDRAKRNGGFIMGPNHPVMRAAQIKERRAEAEKALATPDTPKDPREQVQVALNQRHSRKKKATEAPQEPLSISIHDLSDGVVIYERDGDLMGATYEFEAGQLKLGESFEVEAQYAAKG